MQSNYSPVWLVFFRISQFQSRQGTAIQNISVDNALDSMLLPTRVKRDRHLPPLQLQNTIVIV